eukprot:3755692-Rhodomonas_salina.1
MHADAHDALNPHCTSDLTPLLGAHDALDVTPLLPLLAPPPALMHAAPLPSLLACPPSMHADAHDALDAHCIRYVTPLPPLLAPPPDREGRTEQCYVCTVLNGLYHDTAPCKQQVGWRG